MARRIFSLIAIGLIASMVFTAVVHACADLSAMRAIVQAPCDHGASPNEPRSKTENDNCDLVRYGMLSTKASSSDPESLKLYSIPLDNVLFVNVSLVDTPSLLWRSQIPPLIGIGVSPRLSHVVLRI